MAGEGGWDEAGAAGFGDRKLKNTLPLYGNKDSMNLNSMILTNILGSPYFKEELINFKTFHEVIDEIYYKVSGDSTDKNFPFMYDSDLLYSIFMCCVRLTIWNHGKRTAEN